MISSAAFFLPLKIKEDIVMKKTLCALLATAAISAFAVGRGTDSTGEYWEDEAGVKHYYLFQRTFSGTCWSTLYTYDRTQTETATGKWVDGSIWTLERNTSYGGSQNTVGIHNAYGVHFETARSMGFENFILNLGAYGLRSEVGGFKLAFYNSSGAKRFILKESQTWSGPASDTLTSDAFLIVVNQPYEPQYANNLYADDDVVLTIEGNTFVSMLTYTNDFSNAEVVIKSPAIMSIPQHNYGTGRLNARKVTFDAGAGIYFGKNTELNYGSVIPDSHGYRLGSYPLISPVQIAPTIVLTNGATLTAKETTTVSGGVTIVSAGTMTNKFSGTFKLVDDDTVLRIPAGATLDLTAAKFIGTGNFSVEGEGVLRADLSAAAGGYGDLPSWLGDISGFDGNCELTVTNGTLVVDNAEQIPERCVIVTSGDGAVLVVDDTGFDPETLMGGTRNLETPSRLVVTDAEVTGDVTVNKGETLLVFGNGLGANASLDIWGGTVMFRRTATISAPTWYTNDVHYKTFDASVTGTVASAFSVTKGDVSTSDKSSSNLYMDADPGVLMFSGSGQWKSFTMNTGNALVTGDYDVYGAQLFNGGHMTVRDGGHIKIKNQWQYLRLDNNPSCDVCLEISDGGTFEKVSGNCYTYIGRSAAHESKLLLTGGTYIHKYDELNLKAGAVIDIESGVFQTGRRITCTSSATADNTKILIRGGTLYYGGGGAGYAYAMFDGVGSCNVHVVGSNGTLKWAWQYNMPDTTNETATAQATWTCEEGARLKVIGPDYNTAVMTLHNFEADGLALDFNNSNHAKPLTVRIVDPKDPLSVGYVLPGKANRKIVASNAVPDLVASYVVPSNFTFDVAAELPTGWYENFGEVTLGSLTFDEGAALAFPFFNTPYSPLSLTGKLYLPPSLRYSVAVGGARTDADAVPVIVPAQGVVGGGCAFTCTGGVRAAAATLSVADDALAFSYKTCGIIFSVR